MVSEARYRKYDVISHVVISVLSGALVCLGVLPEKIKAGIPLFDVLSVVTSVFLFGCSLVIYGFRFSDEAAKHRECYLSLQRLADSCDDSSISDKYHDILAKFPNHSSSDFDCLIIERTLFKNEPLTSDGENLQWTVLMVCEFVIHKIVFWTLSAGFPTFLIGFVGYWMIAGWRNGF